MVKTCLQPREGDGQASMTWTGKGCASDCGTVSDPVPVYTTLGLAQAGEKVLAPTGCATTVAR